MKLPICKLLTCMIFIIAVAISTAYAQGPAENKHPLIERGTLLTGFSLGITNASRDDFNQEFEREVTNISIQLEGIYFINEQIGVGPLLGYKFTYRDLEDSSQGADRDVRNSAMEYGIKGGWYIPTATIWGGTGGSYLFLDGGVSLLRTHFKVESRVNEDPRTQIGFQLGTGFLFPVGKRIALETKLGFQSRRREYRFAERGPDNEITGTTQTRWLKEVALSVGLKVGF